MKFLTPKTWDGLNLPDWRARFFIECYSESLSVNTPHFHQAKMMGVIDLAKEVLENIKVFEANDKGKGYLISSLKELKRALERDVVAKEIFNDLLGVFDDCSKNFNSEKFPRSLIIQLGILCKRIVEDEVVYFDKLEVALVEVVCGATDVTKKERITNSINSLTRRYVTALLNLGYSPTFLFNKTQLLTRTSNYNGRNFKDQLKFFISSLDRKTRDFHVFFGIKTNKKTTVKNYKPYKGVKLLTEIPEKHFTISTKTFSKFSPDYYIKITVEAHDYIGAALIASERIESEFDLLKTLSSKLNLDMHKSCYVDYKAKGNTYQRDVNVSLLNNLLTYDHRSTQLNNYLSFDFRENLELPSIRQIEGVLKNLRQVKESARLEQKLLNLWVSLESLNYSGDDKSIISSITNFFPKIYAINSVKQRINYVLSLLITFKAEIPESVRERHGIESELFDENLSVNDFYKITVCKTSAQEICESISELDFLYFRFYELYKVISDKKKIKIRLSNTREDIENQLYRIYQKRNNIVHVGFSDSLNHYAINHLSDYVNTLLLMVFDVIERSKKKSRTSLDDILLSTQLVIDNKFNFIEKNSINNFNELSFDVII